MREKARYSNSVTDLIKTKTKFFLKLLADKNSVITKRFCTVSSILTS